MSRTLCVVDTNVLLHALSLDQIPWPDLVQSTEVEIVIVSRVLRELDDKKNGDSEKLKNRARRVLSQINSWLPSGSRTAEIIQGVTLRVHSREPAARDGLDFSVSDDRILACALELRESGDVRLVTGDTSMRFKAEDWGLQVVSIPEQYRVREEGPTKANRTAAARLVVGFFEQDAQPKSHLEVRPVGLNADAELAAAERQLRAIQQKALEAERKQAAERAMLERQLKNGDPFAEFSLQRHRDMARSGGVRAFLDNPSVREPTEESWERHIAALRRFNERHMHTASVSIGVLNAGSAPASDIIVELQFPFDVAVLDEEPPIPPTPQPHQALIQSSVLRAALGDAAPRVARANVLTVATEENGVCVRITSKQLMHSKRLTWPIWVDAREGFQIRGRVLVGSPPTDEEFALNIRVAK